MFDMLKALLSKALQTEIQVRLFADAENEIQDAGQKCARIFLRLWGRCKFVWVASNVT
ncbi:hypothetical protein ABENE_08255 [Asticcacaulis benevestitus DSM 16100 = ATCC BAA-896]|uniref:Uncharacterized protein n=1 Tax=Asticcacaulis benevestitus DSM 16100 = ATCC BAA-896 TaxID=1121022 RepID=V4RM55_9CAUL|nr:hypothetical protein ABENE_08255 [Asticcacaulis benevestitus DSM 16100 = ATCC BAA-896]